MPTQLLDVVRNSLKNWWIPLVIGILFVIVAIFSFANPESSYAGITVAFSVSFIIAGVLEIFFSISNRKTVRNWGWILFMGIVSTLLGGLLMSNLTSAEVILPFFFGFMVLFRSVAGISYAIDMRSYGILEWGSLMVLSVLGVIFSFILLWNPEFAGFTVYIWVSLAMLLIGAFNIVLAFRMRKVKNFPEKVSKELKDRIEKVQEQINEGIKSVTGDDAPETSDSKA